MKGNQPALKFWHIQPWWQDLSYLKPSQIGPIACFLSLEDWGKESGAMSQYEGKQGKTRGKKMGENE